MQLTILTISLSTLLTGTSAVSIAFYTQYGCAGSSLGCQNIPADYCCEQPSPVYAFSAEVTGLVSGQVSTLFSGDPLGVCTNPALTAGNVCGSANVGGGGVSGASYHTYGIGKRDKREEDIKCLGNVAVNHIATHSGTGAWELEQGALTDDEFKAIVGDFHALANEDHESFLKDHGAVYNDQVVASESFVTLR